MARIAHFREILKDDFFKKIKFFAEFLSARDILDAAAAENYHWRERIWTPIEENKRIRKGCPVHFSMSCA